MKIKTELGRTEDKEGGWKNTRKRSRKARNLED
jgi:hypothetical protein